ncbi:hypothetical protein ASC75_23795 [Aminobacter sp. DSM 101952]|nr:hypothetical protein ASC75_23795 [Aminobacter sp. DSM 101952]
MQRAPGLVLAFTLMSGCATQIGSGPVDASKYAAMTCTELNTEIGGTSQSISATAISRGRVSNFSVPAWAPGGARAVELIKQKQTARIERLQAQQSAIEAARRRNCS